MDKTAAFLAQATTPLSATFPKTAGYLKASAGIGRNWCGEVNYLDDFVGTPLYDRASALVEKELAIRAQRVQERINRPRPSFEDTYDLEEQIRLDKDLLHLELHRIQNAQAQAEGGPAEGEAEDEAAPKIAAFIKLAAEAAGEIKYESRVADGDPRKSWPDAALRGTKTAAYDQTTIHAAEVTNGVPKGAKPIGGTPKPKGGVGASVGRATRSASAVGSEGAHKAMLRAQAAKDVLEAGRKGRLKGFAAGVAGTAAVGGLGLLAKHKYDQNAAAEAKSKRRAAKAG